MKLRFSVASCLLALGTLGLPAHGSDGYFRFPDLHQNTLVYTAEGDLWVSELGSQRASRLTTHAAEETQARISPDGSQVAFVANYDGADEVYVMPIGGGEAKRLSFENSRVRLQGWSKDGRVLYTTDNAFGPANHWVLRLVSPESLAVEDLPLADAIEGALDDSGEYLYFVRFGLQATGDNAKVYRGGARGELWRYKLGSKAEAERLIKDHQGSLRQPMSWNGRIYFISDADGNDNLYSLSAKGDDLKQHSTYKDFQIRAARISNGKLVFQMGADIRVLDIASGKDELLPLDLVSDFPARRARWVNNPMDYVTDVRFAPSGDKAVITARSQVAIAAADGRRLVQVDLPKDSRIRNAVLSEDGRYVYGISDASGEQELWRFPADGSEGAMQLTKDASAMRMSLVASPDGRFLAHDDYLGNLYLYDTQKGSNSKIIEGHQGLGPFGDIIWSPDSRFIAVSMQPIGQNRSQVVLYSVDEKKQQSVTSDKYESFSPSFSVDGEWLYFLSNREFNATPGAPWGDRNMGPVFDRRTGIFALALTAKARFPFERPTELSRAPADKADKAEKPSLKVEWDSLNRRLWQVPVGTGNFSNLTLADGRLYVLDSDIAGNQSALKTAKFDGLAPKLDTYGDDIGSYVLSRDGKKLLLSKKSNPGELLIVDGGDKLPGDLGNAKVRTQDWQLELSPRAEWRQMFDDAWLMHRDSFYDKKMRGLDWQATREKYLPLLERVSDRNELNDLFMQMMGELDALHSQVRGGDVPKDANTPKPAGLGARLEQSSQGVKIGHIFKTDPELPMVAGPLARPGVDAKEGDIISAINGKRMNNVAEVAAALRNQAGKQVLLTLKRGATVLKTVVTPVSSQDEAGLRYQDWVNHNADKVRSDSQGRIGYLHLYAMGAEDIASFAREFYANYDKDGLVIDVRRNRGGNIDSWVIEKLLRKAWAFWQPTHGDANTNMQQTFRGHLVVLTDQLTYSDGETFSAGIKALGLAPLVGKQTAGAGVWLSGRNALTDKGMARVAEYPQYAMDGRWVIEGRGVSPDVEVDNLPFATFNGEDAQLAKGLELLKAKIAAEPLPELKAKPMREKGEADDIR
ncbi:PDZ domain-containing protein [Shewanella sp. JM162201]|uniref:Tricorn protease homolog n=1 Tax=Shewanella jiangmenensis TaxID=2837387 RepID=A0ABS5V2F5_9GAMM|nr:S41 family peptidase [Shewanella jiangmenensis]MBT1443233.1 PDZ domain-containing protein [Shewanella jiangmenensis]